MSIDEAQCLFWNNENGKCRPTAYAKSQGAESRGAYVDNDAGWWWLRSPGDNDCIAAYVGNDGWVNESGFNVDYDILCVRPVLWVSSL